MTEGPTNADSTTRAVEAALTASRALVGIAATSMSHLVDVTLPQYRALVVLAGRGPLRSGDLAHHLDVHPSTLTRLIDRLVAKSLVSRTQSDNRREVVVSLEPAGMQLIDDVSDARRSALRAALDQLTADELASLTNAFSRFAAVVGEIPDAEWRGARNLVVLGEPVKARYQP